MRVYDIVIVHPIFLLLLTLKWFLSIYFLIYITFVKLRLWFSTMFPSARKLKNSMEIQRKDKNESVEAGKKNCYKFVRKINVQVSRCSFVVFNNLIEIQLLFKQQFIYTEDNNNTRFDLKKFSYWLLNSNHYLYNLNGKTKRWLVPSTWKKKRLGFLNEKICTSMKEGYTYTMIEMKRKRWQFGYDFV